MDQFGISSESSWMALIADLVGSRRAADRASQQSRLVATLETLNARHRADLAAPLALSRGDEVQGLLRTAAAAVPILVELADSVHPAEWRCGLGWGRLTTAIGEDVARLDGPAFHLAREALEEGQAAGRWVVTKGLHAATAAPLEGLFGLMQALRSRWTDRQLEFVRTARGALQKDVANRFGVSPSTVSESLKAAAFSAIREGEAAAITLLEEFAGRGEFASDTVQTANSIESEED